MSILTKIFGDPNVAFLKKIKPLVAQINDLEATFQALTDEQLRNKTADFRAQLEGDKTLNDLLPGAFAAVREAARRTLGLRHYDVQLMAGIVLHQGNISEQKTGEGKTLSATTALYLNALEGKGAHLVTVNDYLSRRDCGWMGPVYHALGMTVGVIIHEQAFVYDPEYTDEKATDERLIHLKPVARKDAYAADITYGTNNEFGFDYLRDNMVSDLSQMVQRDLHYAIVDEVDSILIDEARTPLIISAPDIESADKYAQFAKLVTNLVENEDYNIDEKMRATTLTEAGITKLEKLLGVDNIYTEGGVTDVHHIEQALRAYAIYKRDKDYVVKDGEVVIVDEFTGRMMFGRRYSEGLHQAIEAKEGVEVQRESRTLATITFQNYFRLFDKLAGMTGTAQTEAEEFAKIYNLDVVVIPTHRGMARIDLPDRIYKDEEAKFKAVVKEVKERHATGQPILIGTISIEKNEILSDMLNRAGVEAQVLNAKQHEREANIIAEAGRVGAVTVATNMAGRGVDIKLGGEDATPEQEQEIKDLGGLFILGTERHESRRIDNQLRGRGGRQGDPGASQFYVSTDDDLMRIFGSGRIKSLMERLNVPEDMPIENRMVSRSLEAAQKKVEGHHFDVRKHLVEYDDVLNKHRETIYRKRREALTGDTKIQVITLIEDELRDVVDSHTFGVNEHEWNVQEIYEVVHTIFPVAEDLRLKLQDIVKQAGDDNADADAKTKLVSYLLKLAVQHYNQVEEEITKDLGDEQAMRKLEKGMILRSMDTLWIDHLDAIEHLRTGIGLRGYGQRDPLVEYKREAFALFKELVTTIRKQVVYSIFKVGVAAQLAPSEMQRTNQLTFQAPAKTMSAGSSSLRQEFSAEEAQNREVASRETVLAIDEKTHYNGQRVGRNDLCPCGSGKKFKKCHGQ